MQILFLQLTFTVSALVVFADGHSLEYRYTALTPSYTGFPEFTAVGLLDGKQFMSYSSGNRKLIPEQWIKKSKREEYWKNEEQDMQGHHHRFNIAFATIKNQFNNSTEYDTLQRRYGCEIDDGTTSGYDQYTYNGEDFISLDLNTGTFTAKKQQATNLKHKWESKDQHIHWKNFLEHKCIHLLKTFLKNVRETLESKVPPTASVFHNYSSPPDVVCQATGFFPKALVLSWQKDGEDVYEDVEIRETLPNQDGSFQKRSVLKVSAEDLQKHNYTCVIQHSSLEKDLVLRVSERRILRGGRPSGNIVKLSGGSGGRPSGNIVKLSGGSGGRPSGNIVKLSGGSDGGLDDGSDRGLDGVADRRSVGLASWCFGVSVFLFLIVVIAVAVRIYSRKEKNSGVLRNGEDCKFSENTLALNS